jgi:enoyl-CoA hydratase/carnithine racemase
MSERLHDRVLYEVIDKVACVSLDRPERLNAFDGPMYEGLNEALDRFATDETAWVAVVQSTSDRAFTAGADVKALDAAAKGGGFSALGGLKLDTEMVTDKPIIAAVHGHCVGEGVNLALACDLVFADSTARFTISEVRIGTNAVDIPLKLARRLPYALAFSFLTPGDGKDAAWMKSAGLAEVSAEGEARRDAMALAHRIVEECGPLAVRAQKATLWQASFADEDGARTLGDERRAMIRRSEDYAEGRQAFLEKRKPLFQGS